MTPDQIRRLFRASAIALGLPLVAGTAAAHAAETNVAENAVSFTQLDANKDGYIDAGEASVVPKLAELFAKADANKDSKLSPDEFAAVASMLK